MRSIVSIIALMFAVLLTSADSAQACGHGRSGHWFPGKLLVRGTARVASAPFRAAKRARAKRHGHAGCASCSTDTVSSAPIETLSYAAPVSDCPGGVCVR